MCNDMQRYLPFHPRVLNVSDLMRAEGKIMDLASERRADPAALNRNRITGRASLLPYTHICGTGAKADTRRAGCAGWSLRARPPVESKPGTQ
jgi:hypothetical protein